MPGKCTQPSSRSATPKSRSSASSTNLKPSLLGLKPPAKPKGKKSTNKARDQDAREKLDGEREALRMALEGPDKNKPLVQKKEAPAELARGGDSLAKSMDDVLDLFGAV
ncbi:hypothetical protein JCM10450v2_004467 [Rhodotorula kratochvilovae]